MQPILPPFPPPPQSPRLPLSPSPIDPISLHPDIVYAGIGTNVTVSGVHLADSSWVVCLRAGQLGCDGALAARPHTGSRVTDQSVSMRLIEPAVYKLCVSTDAEQWLDSHFVLLPGVTLTAVPSPPAAAALPPPPPQTLSASPQGFSQSEETRLFDLGAITWIVIALGAAVLVTCGASVAAVLWCCGRRCKQGSRKGSDNHAKPQAVEMEVDLPVLAPAQCVPALAPAAEMPPGAVLLPLSVDRSLFSGPVERLQPMLQSAGQWFRHTPGQLKTSERGLLRITQRRLYLQQERAPDSLGARGPLLEQWHLSDLLCVKRRRHELRHTALELTIGECVSSSRRLQESNTSTAMVYLNFKTEQGREEAIQVLVAQQPQLSPPDSASLGEATGRWQRREMDNYTYLLHLNDHASRSFADLSQYPIMPWVLSDYSSVTLDLDNPRSFRPLSKPLGALDEQRLEAMRARRDELNSMGDELGGRQPLYPTHYSTASYVAYYLLRTVPELTVHIQGGRHPSFDKPSRTFRSVRDTWLNVSQRSSSDVKELVPQFYSDPAFLLATRRGHEQTVDDVELPPWARAETHAQSASNFVTQMRRALESDYVSDHLNEWIDLIFGYKQEGPAARAADNEFHPYTYESALSAVSDEGLQGGDGYLSLVRSYCIELGQVPQQLFTMPHPQRFRASPGAERARAAAILIEAKARRLLGRRRLRMLAATHGAALAGVQSCAGSDSRGEVSVGAAGEVLGAASSATGEAQSPGDGVRDAGGQSAGPSPSFGWPQDAGAEGNAVLSPQMSRARRARETRAVRQQGLLQREAQLAGTARDSADHSVEASIRI